MAATEEIVAIPELEEAKIAEEVENVPNKRKCSLKCVLDAMFFTVRREDITDIQAASAQAFGLLVILVGYVQQLGLLILEELDFGLWGNVFGNINIISLNINIEFGELQGDIGYLLAVYLLPVAIMLWYIRVDGDDAGYEKDFTWLWRTAFVLDVLFFLAFIVLTFVVDLATGFIFAVPLGYIVLLQVGYMLRARYLRKNFKPDSEEDTERKENFFLREISYNDLAMTFSLPLVASTWVSVGILNPNKTLALAAGVSGGILVVWLVIRLYLRIAGAYARDYGDCHDILKWIFLGLFIQKDIYNGNGSTDFKEALFFFPVIVYLEKIFLAIIPTLAVSDLFEADDKVRAAEIGEYIVLAIIFTNFAIVSIFWPLKSRMSLRAEIFSRVSNLLIFSFALINTRFRRNQEEDLEEGEDTEEELYVSIVMIIISTYMLIFWLRLLDIKEFIKYVYKMNTDYFYGLYAKYKWRKVANEADAAKIILRRRKQQVTENEFRVLPYFKNFCAFCVDRTRELTAQENELVKVQNDGKLEITYNSATGVSMDVLRRFGLNILEGLKTLQLGDYENSLVDFELLVNSGTLEHLFEKGMRGFELQYRYVTADEITYLFDTLYKFPCEYLGFTSCTDKDKHDVEAFSKALANKVARCQHLTVFHSESNEFPAESSFNLIESLFALPELTSMTIADAKLSDEDYQHIAKLLVETDHQLENLDLRDNKPKSLVRLEEVAEAAMQTKTLRKLDISAYGIYMNKVFRLQEDFPELRLNGDGYGYLDHQTDRGQACNVVLIDYRDEAVECLTREGFTEKFIDEFEGVSTLLSSFLFFLNDEWKEVAREHINDTYEKEGYEEEDEEAEDDKTVLLAVTLAEIVMKYSEGQYMTLHVLKRLKEFGFDFGKKSGNGKDTILDMAWKHKYKPVQKWAEREKSSAELGLDDLDLDLDVKDIDLELDLGLDDLDLGDLDLDN